MGEMQLRGAGHEERRRDPRAGRFRLRGSRWRTRNGSARLVAVVVAVGVGLAPGARATGEEGLPAEFQQIIPRGQIASVDAPRVGPASEARLPPEAWVLGVSVDGQARAYSLNLLNRHEIVNDRIGEKAFAAVW